MIKLLYLGPSQDREKLCLEAFTVTEFSEIFLGRQLHQYAIHVFMRLFACENFIERKVIIDGYFMNVCRKVMDVIKLEVTNIVSKS